MKYFCQKCNRELEENNFYTYKSGQKVEICKKCLTSRIDNFDPKTYLWLLEKMDVPYIPEEWNVLRDKAFAKNPNKMTGLSVFGKYLSKMRLNQWADYTWADTERLAQEKEERRQKEKENIDKFEEELKAELDAGKISRAQYETLTSAETLNNEFFNAPPTVIDESENPFNEDSFMSEEELNQNLDLTKDDKIYLATKWGRLYKPDQWITLEQLYKDFTEAFDVHDPARLDTVKKICKTSLKMDEAIDCGDIDGYQKLSRVYDALMKAGKFTQAQKKEEERGDFDCVGLIVNFAESKKGGGKIKRHEITTDFDAFDKAINVIKKWNHNIFMNDPTMKQQFENYIQKREIAMEMALDREKAKEMGLEEYQLTDEDIIKSKEAIEHQKDEDVLLLERLGVSTS